MAEAMVLRIVLEGIDNASDDINRNKKEVDNLGSSFTDAEKKGAALVLTVNGLASGLNQMSGGLRKTADAMERTGRGTEAQRDALRGMSDTMELVAGPMEVISGVLTTLATTTYLASQAGITFTGTFGALKGVALAVAGAVSVTALAIGALIAIVAVAIYLVYDYTEGFREWGQVIDNVNYKLERGNQLVRDIIQGARDMKSAVTDFSLSGIRDSINDEIAGLGGIAQ